MEATYLHPPGPPKMNRALMHRTANAIEESDTFDQGVWAHECGTPGCIAGHAAQLAGYEIVVKDVSDAGTTVKARVPDTILEYDIPSAARVALGIDHATAEALFRSYDDEYATPWRAAKVLRHLAATGNVEWDVDTGSHEYGYAVLDRDGRIVGEWLAADNYYQACILSRDWAEGAVIRHHVFDEAGIYEGLQYTCDIPRSEDHFDATWHDTVERAVDAVTE